MRRTLLFLGALLVLLVVAGGVALATNCSPTAVTCQCTGGYCYGSAEEDRILGSEHRDVIKAYKGNDSAGGYGGNDHIEGDSGNDTLYELHNRSSGNDTLYGEPGDDELDGGGGFDKCYGGPAQDKADASCEIQVGIEKPWK